MRAMSWRWVLSGVAAAAVVGCNGGDEPTTPDATTATSPIGTATASVTAPATSTPTSTTTPTTTASVEEEVIAAYYEYWDVYSEALYSLDPGHLEDVMTGPRLERAIDEIESLRAQGQAVRIEVELDPSVIDISANEAAIVDQYRNVSVLLDEITKEPAGAAGDGEVLRDIFTLVRESGRWKVADTVRQVVQE